MKWDKSCHSDLNHTGHLSYYICLLRTNQNRMFSHNFHISFHFLITEYSDYFSPLRKCLMTDIGYSVEFKCSHFPSTNSISGRFIVQLFWQHSVNAERKSHIHLFTERI